MVNHIRKKLLQEMRKCAWTIIYIKKKIVTSYNFQDFFE